MAFVRALRTVHYRLWLAMLATMLIPTVYQTVRIFFLGGLPSEPAGLSQPARWLDCEPTGSRNEASSVLQTDQWRQIRLENGRFRA